MDIATIWGAVLDSLWLLPVLAVLIAADGPLPMLPTETLLLAGATIGFGTQDTSLLVGLFIAAVIGSALGDLLVFGLGRSTQRFGRRAEARCGLATWVRRHVVGRPGVTLVAARLLPGGRLVSTAAAGRYGLVLRRFVPWSLASSAVWAVYMMLIGLALGPVTGGDPLLSLAAGLTLAALTAGGYELARRVPAKRARAAA